MFDSYNGYRLLSKTKTNENDTTEGEGPDEEVNPMGSTGSAAATGGPSLWPLFICLLCTVINLGLFHVSSSTPAPATAATMTRQDIFKLRRPSQYIRLNEIPRPSPPIDRQFNNYPIVVGQVDSTAPDRVIDSAGHRHMVHSGTIVPEDNRVHMSQTVSTVVQFRAIDFGMERCELQLTILPQTSVSMSSKPFTLEIFRLNATLPLDTRALTHKTRPLRVSKVAAVEVNSAVDTHWHRSFSCASEEVLTFELACQPTLDDGECRIEWWQNKSSTETAIYVRQHATV